MRYTSRLFEGVSVKFPIHWLKQPCWHQVKHFSGLYWPYSSVWYLSVNFWKVISFIKKNIVINTFHFAHVHSWYLSKTCLLYIWPSVHCSRHLSHLWKNWWYKDLEFLTHVCLHIVFKTMFVLHFIFTTISPNCAAIQPQCLWKFLACVWTTFINAFSIILCMFLIKVLRIYVHVL